MSVSASAKLFSSFSVCFSVFSVCRFARVGVPTALSAGVCVVCAGVSDAAERVRVCLLSVCLVVLGVDEVDSVDGVCVFVFRADNPRCDGNDASDAEFRSGDGVYWDEKDAGFRVGESEEVDADDEIRRL